MFTTLVPIAKTDSFQIMRYEKQNLKSRIYSNKFLFLMFSSHSGDLMQFVFVHLSASCIVCLQWNISLLTQCYMSNSSQIKYDALGSKGNTT